MFVQLVSNSLQHTDDVTDRSVRFLHTPIDDASVMGDIVKQRMNFYTTLSEFLPDIPRKSHVSPAVIQCFMKHHIDIYNLQHANILFFNAFSFPCLHRSSAFVAYVLRQYCYE